MMDPRTVQIIGGVNVAVRMARLGNEVQNRFRFTNAVQDGAISLHITENQSHLLFRADRSAGVAIFTWQSEGIARYAGLDLETYLLVCGVLALTQWCTLERNPLLVPEDFLHGPGADCLFSWLMFKEEYALLFENPRICAGCLEFYRCLGSEPEVEALLQVVDFAAQAIQRRRNVREMG